MSQEVDSFFEDAKDHGYDTAKIRRCVEEELRRIANRDEKLFKNVLFTLWKILNMSFGNSVKKSDSDK